MADGEAVDEQATPGRRRATRRRALLTGIVSYADGAVSFRCAIRERSDGGARLRLPKGLIVPDRFWLIEVDKAVASEASVVWRSYEDIGVTLTMAENLSTGAAKDPCTRRLKGLWLAASPLA